MAAASHAGRRRLGLPAWQEGAPGDVVVYAADPEEEIAELAEIKGQGACEHTRQLTEAKLADVRRKIAALRRLERELAEVAAECARAPSDTCCPALDRLETPQAEVRAPAEGTKQRPVP